MKRQATPDPDEQKRSKPEVTQNTANRTASGKHPVSPAGPPSPQVRGPTSVGKPVPGVGGKQPPGVGGKHPPGVGGKHPAVGGKQPIARGGKEPAGVGGKQPTSVAPVTAPRPPPQRSTGQPPRSQTPSPRGQPPPGVGGKQPIAYQQPLPESETKQQTKPTKPKQNTKPPVSQSTSPSPTVVPRPRGRPPSNQSPRGSRQPQNVHPYVGKRIKVYYIDEGYHLGTVKSVNESTREFVVHWDEGSTSGVILNEDDETEDADNDDRWSIVEDDRLPGNGVQKGVRSNVRGKLSRGQQLPVGEEDDSDS